jgi:hypothetical protein
MILHNKLYISVEEVHGYSSAAERLHDPGVRSSAASLFVWGATPDTAYGLGATAPRRVVQACVNAAPKNTIRAE